MEPKLSIIVPIYNAEKFLKRCMDSIYAQTFKDYEIILVNDGSQDNSANICRSYCEKDERVRFIDKENGGAGSARNAGIEVARGQYLAFPDADDWFDPTMYEEMYKLAESGNYDVVFSGVNYFKQNEDGGVEYSRSDYCKNVSYHSRKECRENIMTFFPTTTIFDVPWNKIYKRQVVLDNNLIFTNLRRCQDAVFNLDFYNCISSVVATDKAYYNYMENTLGDVQRKFPINYIDINIYYCTHLIDILTQWGVYTSDIKQHYDTTFVLGVYNTMEMFENPNWKLKGREKARYVTDIMNRQEVREFLPTAQVRTGARKKYDIIFDRNTKLFFLNYYIKKLKMKLRKSDFVTMFYRKVKGI